ncbi:MAG: DUF4190 domain-containing protein [Phycisphaeraceae bacterium]|nr:DUF4190 domain-containing protein [Phycisphaeraceae bacterium]
MSQNPYAQPTDYAGAPEYLEPKTSILAIFAFVVSLLGLVACCIPGVGPLGLLMGVLALVMISMSGGRKKGGGFAIAAIAIGLVAGAINVFVIIGASMAGKQWAQFGAIVEPIDQRDLSAVQAKLDPQASAQLDQQQLDAFADSLRAHYGGQQQLPTGLIDAFMLTIKAATATSTAQTASQQEYSPVNFTLVPIPVEYDSAVVVFMMVMDPSSFAGTFRYTNVGYLAPDGTMVWLVPPPSGRGTPTPAMPKADPADGQGGG